MVAGDVVPFDEFVCDALYGADGFYMRPDGGRAGRRGDFLTSPEVGPLFGAVLARWIDRVDDEIGRPDDFTIVDAGAGPGTLARAIRAAGPRCLTDGRDGRYLAVEVSSAQRSSHPADAQSTDEMPAGPIRGVVIANELLDNLPFRLAVFDGAWREAFVERSGDRSTERLSAPFEPVPATLPAQAPHGARAPLVDGAARWVASTLERLEAGALLVVDYGVDHTTDLVTRPWRTWLRTYRDNQRGDHYLTAPGSQDITTEIPFDQLPPADRSTTQAAFLTENGIGDLVDEGRRVWEESASRPDVRAMAMRSRVSESEALLDPSGLGAFRVATWHR